MTMTQQLEQVGRLSDQKKKKSKKSWATLAIDYCNLTCGAKNKRVLALSQAIGTRLEQDTTKEHILQWMCIALEQSLR